jgi:hypothetical protein
MTATAALLMLALLLGPCLMAARLHPRPAQAPPTRYPQGKGRPRVRDHVAVFLYEEAQRGRR